MKIASTLIALCLGLPLASNAFADTFGGVDSPKTDNIAPRQVYGMAVYDVNFVGNGPNSRGQSLKKFLADLIHSKFNNSSGNYIVTLDVSINGAKVVTEPILSASWDTQKFLFITTSEKDNIVVNRNGVLLENIVVDGSDNKVQLSMKMLYSNQSNVDLSLLQEISDLSRTTTVAAFAPGLGAVSTAIQPVQDILKKLLDHYREETIVENTMGAFTKLDVGFPNQFKYKNDQLQVNIYLQTKNSQLPTNFDPGTGKFTNVDVDSVLSSVAAGVGAARSNALDVLSQDNSPDAADIKQFIAALEKATPLPNGLSTPLHPLCTAFKTKLNHLLTTRDAVLVYWAFLKTYGSEMLKYGDGKSCGANEFAESMNNLGLHLGPEWTQ